MTVAELELRVPVVMTSTIDPQEIEKFAAIAEEWWDKDGKLKTLHRFNPIRISFIKRKIFEHFSQKKFTEISLTEQNNLFATLDILDIGCGGGLIAEPFARMGGKITAIDAAEENIKIARAHAEKSQLEINYRNLAAEVLAKEEKKFDVVLALEIIEHVADVEAFIFACSQLVKDDGILFIATINRTAKSFALLKIAAEYVLRWLPIGTHDWRRFMKPSEINSYAEKNGLKLQNLSGFSYNIFTQEWRENERDLDVNFICTFSKK